MEAHYFIRIVFWNISVVYKTKENFIYVTFLFIVILVIFKLFEVCGFCRATTRALRASQNFYKQTTAASSKKEARTHLTSRAYARAIVALGF